MSTLAELAGEALRLAERRAEAKAKRAALRAGGGAVAALLCCLAVGFAAFGGFLLLTSELGPIVASFLMAMLTLLLAILTLLVARQVAQTRKEETPALPPELAQYLETFSQQAGEEIGKAAPYIVAAGFVSGFLTGRK